MNTQPLSHDEQVEYLSNGIEVTEVDFSGGRWLELLARHAYRLNNENDRQQ